MVQTGGILKMWIDSLLEKNLLPERVLRAGIRNVLEQRLAQEEKSNNIDRFVEQMKSSPIAIDTVAANEQHYEVPSQFYALVLGKRMKYSCAYWSAGVENLDQSEEQMLAMTTERAGIRDGMKILDLGCGWGSMALYLAEKFPASKITAVSNSTTQRLHIQEVANQRSLRNIRLITADVNRFETRSKYDRIVSVEMFEHIRNYEKLLEKCFRFLNDHGKLFVHIFVHRKYAYPYVARDDNDWMARHFFTGGLMPSDDLLYRFPAHFEIEKHWRINGIHYSKTAEAWLKNMEQNRKEILQIFSGHYGKSHARKWWSYWRIFFLSCSELWRYREGEEWFVSHYLLKKRKKHA
jgi:cyclopropane-fatty-acyl-phospholipid synthase